MNTKHSKKNIFIAAIMIGVLISFYPIRGQAQKAGILQIPFGFQIKEKVFCECSFNYRFKPARWGIPAPLPPIPRNKDEKYSGGSLATTPFDIPIPLFPQDEYIYSGIEEKEWVIGMTHGNDFVPPFLMACVNFVFTWTGPKCKDEWGWLWRVIGSGRFPDKVTPIW